jgi:methionyl-tRNA formyltransferase
MCSVDWRQSGLRISGLIRALDPRPGAQTAFEGNNLKLFSPEVLKEGAPSGVPGRVVGLEGGLHVETGDGVLRIGEIQYPGKKRLAADEFLRGFPLPEGTILRSHATS